MSLRKITIILDDDEADALVEGKEASKNDVSFCEYEYKQSLECAVFHIIRNHIKGLSE